jgi:hypothetical protein
LRLSKRLHLQIGFKIAFEGEKYDVNIKWIFDRPPASKAKKGGSANAQVFKPGIDSFVREVLQNSKDQALSGKAAEVRFTLSEISGAELDQLKANIGWVDLEPHLEASAKPELVTAGPRLRGGIREIGEGKLRVLVIDDLWTHGLEGDEDSDGNFANLVRHELITGKDRVKSGGSFGLGKSVLWRFSDLSTVFFHSVLASNSSSRLIGRTALPGHECGDEVWEGSGWFGAPDEPPVERAVSVWDDDARRVASAVGIERDPEVPGTSIAILGFDDPAENPEPSVEETCKRIATAAREWFWPAINDEQMSVYVEGSDVSGEVFAVHVNVEGTEVAPFISAKTTDASASKFLEEPGEVIERELKVKVPAQKGGPEGIFSDPKPATEAIATLRIRRAESGESENINTVALQRGTGMVVAYRPLTVRAGDEGIHAVLLAGTARGESAADQALEEFLRSAEPPAHSTWEWTTDRVKAGYETGYRPALVGLYADIDAAIKELTQDDPSGTGEAPEALRKLFPLPGTGERTRTERYRLLRSDATIVGDQWEFEGCFARNLDGVVGKVQPWCFTVKLSLDQEGGGSPQQMPVKRLEVALPAAAGDPEEDGSVVVEVPANVDQVEFSGVGALPSDVPEGAATRVRLRMNVDGDSAAS